MSKNNKAIEQDVVGLHGEKRGIRLRYTVTIGKAAREIYDFWRSFTVLPWLMPAIKQITVIDAEKTHWVVNGPANMTFEWDALIVEDRPGEVLRWRTTEESDIQNEGAVSFKPARGDRGTEMTVEITYNPPAGKIGQALAKFSADEPAALVADAMRRFKQLMETGEIATAERCMSDLPPADFRTLKVAR